MRGRVGVLVGSSCNEDYIITRLCQSALSAPWLDERGGRGHVYAAPPWSPCRKRRLPGPTGGAGSPRSSMPRRITRSMAGASCAQAAPEVVPVHAPEDSRILGAIEERAWMTSALRLVRRLRPGQEETGQAVHGVRPARTSTSNRRCPDGCRGPSSPSARRAVRLGCRRQSQRRCHLGPGDPGRWPFAEPERTHRRGEPGAPVAVADRDPFSGQTRTAGSTGEGRPT